MTTAAGSTTTKTQETNENFNMKQCLNDLTKIPQKEFEAQFRNWMEKDGVARAMQAKLRADLIANFNKTNLGKHIIGQTPLKRLTLSPMEMALNTLVAEFLFVQNCHFTLSVYSTEAPFRNTLPDFDCSTHFRFKENEVTEIVGALSGPANCDWNIRADILKNYLTNKSTALLYHVLKVLLETKTNTKQHKITVGTNTKAFICSDRTSSPQSQRDSEAEYCNTSFHYLNRYLVILSRKVKEMTEQIERLHGKGSSGPPRVRVRKSGSCRKYRDINRSLERVTQNFKQMAHAKSKSKSICSIAKAIEDLSKQFQKCAKNLENFPKDLKMSTSSDMINSNFGTRQATATTTAASQTETKKEKTFGDWLHEMRYTRNGQRFLDRIERSFVKALQKQKSELLAENEIKLRHQKELLRIRYKQKVMQEICNHGSQSARRNETTTSIAQSNDTIGEQFRQFELKHFDLLNKIYETDHEHRASDSRHLQETPHRSSTTTEKVVQFNRSPSDFDSRNTKLSSRNEHVEQSPEPNMKNNKEKNLTDFRQQVKTAIGEIIAEDKNVDQIVSDAKLRVRELEQESNQLTENFLGYLERQREQKLAAREAAQSLWHDYMNEREKMQQQYQVDGNQVADEFKSKPDEFRETLKNFLKEASLENKSSHKLTNKDQKDSSSETSSSFTDSNNPIKQAKENLFECERLLKAQYAKNIAKNCTNVKNDLHAIFNIDENYCVEKPSTSTNNRMRAIRKEPLSGAYTNAKQHKIDMESASKARLEAADAAAANLQSSLESLQNDFVNSTRSKIIATAKEAIRNQRITTLTTNAILAAAVTAKSKTTTKSTATAAAASAAAAMATISRTLNKNKADGGASVAEAAKQQDHSTNNHKIRSDAANGQKHTIVTVIQQQQRTSRASNVDLNNSFEVPIVAGEIATSTLTATSVPFVQTSKSPSMSKLKVSGSIGTELSRKAVLKETLARMQQLFSPHQLHHQKQNIILPDVSAEQEQQTAKNEMEKFRTKAKNQLSSLTTSQNTANANGPIAPLNVDGNRDCERILGGGGHYTNNLQLKQQIVKGTSKERQQPQQQQEQQEQIAKIPTSMRNLSDWSVGVAATTSTSSPTKQTNRATTSTTLHSIDEGNKTVEASVDWQQIACGPSGRQNEAKINASKMKSEKKATAAKEIYDELRHIENDDDYDYENDGDLKKFTKVIDADAVNLSYEPGEIIESTDLPQGNVIPTEISEWSRHSGEYAGDDDVADVDNILRRTPLASDASLSATEVSSFNYRLSADGGAAGDGTYTRRHRTFTETTAGAIGAANGSDSGSDFWA